MKRDNKCVDLFLLVICVAVSIMIIFSLFTYGLTVIHSDNAVEMLALNSILDNKNLFPSTWVYANGDINIMRTQIFLLLPYLFIKDWSIARMMGSLLILVFAALSICYMSKRIFHNNSWLLIIPLFLILLPGVYDVVLYLGMYSGTMIYITVIPILVWSYIELPILGENPYFLLSVILNTCISSAIIYMLFQIVDLFLMGFGFHKDKHGEDLNMWN